MFSKSSLPPFLSPKEFSKINKGEKQSEKKGGEENRPNRTLQPT
jgi:hypothetical protein